ncbi:hypothetical protein Q7P36_002837 [Cladosporium allicinum]
MLAALLLLPLGLAAAEDGLNAWLRYALIPNAEQYHGSIPSSVHALNSSEVSPVYTAGEELRHGISSMFGSDCEVKHEAGDDSADLIVGTVDAYSQSGGNCDNIPELMEDGFYLDTTGDQVLILGQNERGAIYGAFEYLSMLGQGNITEVAFASNPDAPIRWINQWDNLRDGGTHGSIERGYGGDSIFFWDGVVREDLTRAAQYARILSSIGINAVVINNVNANETILNATNLDGVARIADAFRPYGVRLGLSMYFASPASTQLPGYLDTFDPLDEKVQGWWNNITDVIYEKIPDFAGYLVKANSEGQPGPITYNRTLAEGANMFARALAPHDGTVFFRAFVYDHLTLNETDWHADRANAAVDFFEGLDTEFDHNVVVQIKHGPIDFQVREPVSPLFTHLRQTPSVNELQITQEYLGQQAHLVYLAPYWKEILDFDLRVDNQSTPLYDILGGRRFGTKRGGYAGVANVGMNSTWLGSHLAMSNLYAFGKLAWNPHNDPSEILDAWTRLTFSHDQEVVDTINHMSMVSWPMYENYTGNLGIQTLTNILNGHYGPDPLSQDGNPWGQWTRTDEKGVGMDRTTWNGTAFAGQYPAQVTAMYDNIDTVPDNLLLWFHHVPYDHVLKSGKTVIQHFYDAHYEGAAVAQTFPTQWSFLSDKIDPERYEHVAFRLNYQAGHSLVWRDSIVDLYYNRSQIADSHDPPRVDHHPWRLEAEDMTLDGYERYQVNPFYSASSSWAIVTSDNSTTGTASAAVPFDSGLYDVAVVYYDQAIGNATWELWLDDSQVGEWHGDLEYILGKAPTFYIDGQAAARVTFKGVEVEKGQELKIVGHPDGNEPAPVDYVVFLPEGVLD